MAHDPEDELSVQAQKLLNATGFPFQLFVNQLLAEQVSAGPHLKGDRRRYRLESLADELGWQEGSAFGFIDSVVGAAMGPEWRIRYVVETKRHDEGVAWLFLRSTQQREVLPTAALLRAWANAPKPNYRQWARFIFDPPTEMASFCVFADLTQGKRHGERPEEIVGQLLRGVEALAVQEPMLSTPLGQPRKDTIYFPIVVTNCPLYLATFDASKVNAEKGRLLERFHIDKVPYIRFQKSFPSTLLGQGSDLKEVAASLERTALVVSASHLADFLNQFGSLQAEP